MFLAVFDKASDSRLSMNVNATAARIENFHDKTPSDTGERAAKSKNLVCVLKATDGGAGSGSLVKLTHGLAGTKAARPSIARDLKEHR